MFLFQISQSPTSSSPEQSGSSGAAGIINVDSSPLGVAIKHPPPPRINPPIDTFAKKKVQNSTNLKKC